MSDQNAILVVTAKVNKAKMEDVESYLEQISPCLRNTGANQSLGIKRFMQLQEKKVLK
ncbi:MAG: hypothetical protein ACJAT1_000917 [Marivirga sp.]|jgi:hypothetical protein